MAPAVGWTLAQGPGPQGGDSPQAALDMAFTCQGRLTEDASGLVTDHCDFEFSLWDAAGSGSPPTGEVRRAGALRGEGLGREVQRWEPAHPIQTGLKSE